MDILISIIKYINIIMKIIHKNCIPLFIISILIFILDIINYIYKYIVFDNIYFIYIFIVSLIFCGFALNYIIINIYKYYKHKYQIKQNIINDYNNRGTIFQNYLKILVNQLNNKNEFNYIHKQYKDNKELLIAIVQLDDICDYNENYKVCEYYIDNIKCFSIKSNNGDFFIKFYKPYIHYINKKIYGKFYIIKKYINKIKNL